MTLYWWMHWFWITTIKVLVSFSWSTFTDASPLPLAPIVQNGHQNGPYLNELPAGRESSTLPSLLSTVSEPNARIFSKALPSDNRNGSVNLETTPSHQVITEREVITASHTASEPTDITSPVTGSKFTIQDDIVPKEKNKLFQMVQGASTTEITLSSTASFSVPNTNDNDDIHHTSSQIVPLVESHVVKGKEGNQVLWNDRFPGREDSFHGKHGRPEHINGNGRESVFEEVLMNDGPYNPTGSFINSTNIRVKTVVSTSKTPEMTTIKEAHSTHMDEENENEMTEKVNGTSSERTVLYITPTTFADQSDNTNKMLKSVANNGVDKTENSTENILEEAYNSTFIVGDNTTLGSKTEAGLSDNASKAKNHEENAISAINFDHSNIEESTKVSSSIVQSVIDDSVNSRGKSMTAMAITGIVMGVLIGIGLLGAGSFVVYRRRYLNNPQTLNDKCSNPDSSGYIDDSTLRENSEEMYSLDNDSFLNSLEAMTIQNYWTDNVKHTKL